MPLPGRDAGRDLSRPGRARGRGPGEPGRTRCTPATGSCRRTRRSPEACARAGIVWVGPAGRGHAGHGPQGPGQGDGRRGRRARPARAPCVDGRLPRTLARRPRRCRLPAAGQGVGRRGWTRHAPGRAPRRARARPWPRPSARRRPRSVPTRSSWSGTWPSPRHVEVQVIGDTHGTVLHLFDRECSVQRRHQKVIEEAPAVLVRRRRPAAACGTPPSPRRRPSATRASARSSTWSTASGFYFLEMNTRLQVEHGVTELVTGLDLVGLQLPVAAGPPAALHPGRGHRRRAMPIEVRLCAERPREDYRPTPGTRRARRAGPRAPGLRADAAIESGSVVSPAYDSLVAKLMAHGDDRRRPRSPGLSRALRALELDGLETNRDLLRRGARRRRVPARRGRHPLSRRPAPTCATPRLPDEVRHRHAAAAGLHACSRSGPPRASSRCPPPAGATWARALHADDAHAMPPGRSRCACPATDAAGRRAGRRRVAGRGSATTPGRRRRPHGPDGLRRRYRVRLWPRTARSSTDPRASRPSPCAPRTTPTSGRAWPGSAGPRCPAP